MKQDETAYAGYEVRESSAIEPAYSEDGVDLTLIRWMLSLTPRERLEVMQQSVQSIMRMRDAIADV
jgi:hypothetical protein